VGIRCSEACSGTYRMRNGEEEILGYIPQLM
jgi:hypothetical protein